MTLNFPNAPTNGQVFQGYQYSTPKGVWQAFPQVNPGQYGAVPGSIMLWFSDVIPAAALAMEGQTITSGVALFPALAAIYPAWVSGANLVLPDTRGRVLVGRDATQSEFNALGAASGFKTHTLTTAQMPSHTHIQNSHNHIQDAHAHGGYHRNTSYKIFGGGGGDVVALDPQTYSYNANTSSTTATNQATTATNQNAGSGEAHNNLQPYIVARYIVWAASIVGQYDPIVQQALVASVAALQSRLTVTVADFTALVALGTANNLSGDQVFVLEGEVYMLRSGSSWRQVTTATFATAAARDTAYAKAGAVFRVARARALDTSSLQEFIFTGSAWVTPSTHLAVATFTGLSLPNGVTTAVPQQLSVPAVPWARTLSLTATQTVNSGTSSGSFLQAFFSASAGTVTQALSLGGFLFIFNAPNYVTTSGFLALPANTAAVVTLNLQAGGVGQHLSNGNGTIIATAPGP